MLSALTLGVGFGKTKKEPNAMVMTWENAIGAKPVRYNVLMVKMPLRVWLMRLITLRGWRRTRPKFVRFFPGDVGYDSAEYEENTLDRHLKGRSASGDRSGARLHKDRMPRGDNHYARKNPEKLARGDRHFSRTMPERVARGDRHSSKTKPERVARGERHGMAKLNVDSVLAIREKFANGEKVKNMASEFGVTQETIRGIVNRKKWSHIP